jgi:hypothetical protein
MKMGEAIQYAVEKRDVKMVGRIVDRLRFKCGMNYKQIREFAHKVSGYDPAEWDSLMEEVDSLDSQNQKEGGHES